MTDTDIDLLERYRRDRAEDAFAEIVRRHLNLVYSAALRQVRSPQLAEEVAQTVFTDLARNARPLAPGTILAAWLYRVAHRTAIDVVRRESRRQLREQAAHELTAMNATAAEWTHIKPLLDQAMHALDDTDHAAVLLRYFENKTLREVGAALGASEDAAQKRVSRAIERLREFFIKRGVTVGASGLAAVISVNAVQPAPIGLSLTISTAATIAATIAATSIATTATATATAAKAIAMTTLQKTLITATIVLGITTPLVIHYQAQKELREQNAVLRQKLQRQLDASAQLETDNERLSQLIEQATNKSLSKEQFREILRLRGEVGQLRNQKTELEKLRTENRQFRSAQNSRLASPASAGDSSQTYYPKESWAFAGFADPEATFQSLSWAMNQGDLKTMLAGACPEERARMEKEFEGKSESQIATASAAEMEAIKEFRILKKEALSEDEMILTIFGDGKDETAKLKFTRIGNEWKMAGRVKDSPR